MVSVLEENNGVRKTDIKQITILMGNSREELQKLMGPGSEGTHLVKGSEKAFLRRAYLP